MPDPIALTASFTPMSPAPAPAAGDAAVQFFDPPMCCPTGLCGQTLNQTLRLRELPMDWSKQIDVKVFASVDTAAADDVAKQRFGRVIDNTVVGVVFVYNVMGR